MNKATLMRTVSKTTGLSLREASLCIDSVIEAIGQALCRGERIELRGFGVFSIKQMSAKKYPSAYSAPVIPAHGRIIFRPSENLRKSVWNNAGGKHKELSFPCVDEPFSEKERKSRVL